MFPGATAAENSLAPYAIIGAPLERSTSFYPGTRFGPDRIRHFAASFEDYDHRTDTCFSDLGVVDCGDLRGWQDAEEYLSFLTGDVKDVVEDGGVPIVLGGEHTVSIAPVRATEPEVYVCLDAHLDLRSEYDADPWSHATTTHHVRDLVEEVILVGARSGSEAEWDRVQSDTGITVVPPDEAGTWVEDVSFGDRDVYLSFDIDVLDPAFAPATGTREPYGLRPRTARSVVQTIAPEAVGADIVEVNDRDEGEAATLAAKLVREFILTHAATHT